MLTVPPSLVVTDGDLRYLPRFIAAVEARSIFEDLLAHLPWQEEAIDIASRRVTVPRLVCWHGDPGAMYRYSGVDHVPAPWTATLLRLRDRVQEASGQGFNAVLGNLYRNERDSMGWHADKEKSLGIDPVIASLSFGAARLFKLRHNKTGESLDLLLEDGSLLIMGGSLQHHWRHCVPRSRKPCDARINLTFRNILAA